MFRDEVSVKAAIARARDANKNTYIIGEELNHANFEILIESIRAIPGRVRLCFTENVILGETQGQFETLFRLGVEVDALIFIKTVIQNFTAFAAELQHCQSLATLSFSKCRLTDQHIDALIPSIKSLPHLASFDISNDQISPWSFTNICRALASCRELTTLNWTNNQLGDCSSFVDLMKSSPSLRFLDFSGCVLTESWMAALSELLDANWQIADLKTTVHDPIFLLKVKRNNNRYLGMRRSLNSRMARFAQPLGDEDVLFGG